MSNVKFNLFAIIVQKKVDAFNQYANIRISYYKTNGENRMSKLGLGYVLLIILAISSVAAWCTHILHCLIEAKYLLLIAGAFIAPVGVIHGIGIWFGVPW